MFELNGYALNPYAIPTAVTAVAMLLLGSTVAVRERASNVSLLFYLMTLSVSVWLTGVSFMYCSTEPGPAAVWARVTYVGIPFIPAAIYHFSVVLLEIARAHRVTVILNWVVAAFFSVAIIGTDVFIGGLYRYRWGYYTTLTVAALPFLTWFCVALGASFAHYVVQYRKTQSRIHKKRVVSFMIAFAVGYLGVVDYLASFGIGVYPFGYLSVAAFLVLAARAVWRYHFVDLTPQFAASKILDTMDGAVLVVDMDGHIRVANRAAAAMLGEPEKGLVGKVVTDLLASSFTHGVASDTLMRGETIRDRAMRWSRPGGETIDVSVSASMLRDETGVPVGVVYVATDVTERTRVREIEHQALHDALTGLANRTLFRNKVSSAVTDFPKKGRVAAVFFIDLDGFKTVNDTLGHQTGDELLRAVARRLESTLRASDVVARFGGDEFTVLAELRVGTDAELVAQKLVSTVAQPYHIDDRQLSVSASIGVAIQPNHGEDAETLVQSADAAMYLAKKMGKNNYQLAGATATRLHAPPRASDLRG